MKIVLVVKPAADEQAHFEVYKDSRGEWRWRFKHHQILADSSESYKNKRDALQALNRLKSYAATAPIEMS